MRLISLVLFWINFIEQKMVEKANMEVEGGDENLGRGTMITSLCWVPRGRAKPLLKEADDEQNEADITKHKKV